MCCIALVYVSSIMTYLFSVTIDEQVKGNSGHHVDEEPAFEVVDGDTHRVAHHLIIRIHICCPERKIADYIQSADINSCYSNYFDTSLEIRIRL